MSLPRKVKTFTLLCHRDVELASRCLPSFVRHCRDPIALMAVDDGSLTTEDVSRLRAAVPGLTIHRRAEIDALVTEALKDFPLCRKYREWCPWAAKLLDIPIYAGEDFVYIDSDILFLRDFSGFEELRIQDASLVSMHGFANVYSFKLSDRLSRLTMPPMIARLNAGFLFVRQKAFDLDLIERFLHQSQHDKRPTLWEQTAWAVMAAKVPSAFFNRRQIAFPHMVFDSECKLKWQPVAIHFVGGTRHLISGMNKDQLGPAESGVTRLTTERTGRLTAASQLADVFRHRLLLRKSRRSGVTQ